MAVKEKNKFGPAFDKFMDEPAFKNNYQEELKELALSELILALMENDSQSVRKLADLAGISPTTLQNVKSGKNNDMKLSNFISIVEACGYTLKVEKGNNSWALRA